VTAFEDIQPGMKCVYHRTFPVARMKTNKHGRVIKAVESIEDARGPLMGTVVKTCRKSKMVRILVHEDGQQRELVVRDKYLVV
jgi:hypothetical protein